MPRTKNKRIKVVGGKGPAMVNIPDGGIILDNEKSQFYTANTANQRLLSQIVKNSPQDEIFEKASNVYRSFDKRSRPLLPGEFHYGFHNFTGAGTRIDLPSVLNTKPINDVDRVSKIHDIEMAQARTEEDVKKADEKAIRGYKKYRNQNGAGAALISIGKKRAVKRSNFKKKFVTTRSMGGEITNSTKLKTLVKAVKAGHLTDEARETIFSSIMQNLSKFRSRKMPKNRDLQSDVDDMMHMSIKKLTSGKRLPKSVNGSSIRALTNLLSSDQASFGSTFKDIAGGIEHIAGAAAKVAPIALPFFMSDGGMVDEEGSVDQASLGSFLKSLAKKTKAAGRQVYNVGKKHVIPGFKKYVLPILKEEFERGGYDKKVADAAAKRVADSGIVERGLNKISSKSSIAKAVVDHGRERKVISRMVGRAAGKEAERAAHEHLNLATGGDTQQVVGYAHGGNTQQVVGFGHGGKITHYLALGGDGHQQQFVGYSDGGEPLPPETTQQLVGYALGGAHTTPVTTQIIGFSTGGQLVHFDSSGNIIPTQNNYTSTHTGGFDRSGETVQSLTADPPAVPRGVGQQNVAPPSYRVNNLLGRNGHGIFKGGSKVAQSAAGSKIRLGLPY